MKRRILYFTPLLALVLLAGCTFAYFNVFYNAEQYFKDAQEAPLRDNGKPNANAVQNYNKAIKKCGIILTDYKDSRWADDALYMLARCMYYKGNSYTQAQEKFTDLINFYPESPFVGDSWLYIAKCYYEINKKDDAYKVLKDFIANSEFEDYHPQALLLISDFYVQQKQFLLSERYLQQLLDEYKDSDQYEEAFLLLGKMHKEQREFEKSNEVFQQLLDSRVDRRLKLDARYLMGENYIDLHEYEKALKIANKLMKDEYLGENIPKAQLLQARAYVGLNRQDEAIDLFDRIIKDNNHTLVAAAASYHMGDMYFKRDMDFEKAVEAYKQVGKHSKNSEFYKEADTREDIASQIKGFYDTERKVEMVQRFKDELRLAEYYLLILEKPDSSLAVYDRLAMQEHLIQHDMDSLIVQIDSLTVLNDSLMIARIDSLQDSKGAIETSLDQLHKEFIPFSKFVSIWIYLNKKNDPEAARQIASALEEKFPDNKYTYAAGKLIAGEPVEITTYSEIKAKEEFDSAITLMNSEPQITINRMKEIAERYHNDVSRQAEFTAGYIYYFILDDATSARPWFERVLEQQDDYSDFIGTIYRDSVFIRTERLPYLVELEELEKQKLLAQQDSLLVTDSTDVVAQEPDRMDPPGLPHGFHEDDVDSAPRALMQEMPMYPPGMMDKEEAQSGAVVLDILVTPDGTVEDIRVKSSFMPGPNEFDESAIRAARNWVFTPARKNGEAVPYRMIVSVPFDKPGE